jgi:hypothetical protein
MLAKEPKPHFKAFLSQIWLCRCAGDIGWAFRPHLSLGCFMGLRTMLVWNRPLALNAKGLHLQRNSLEPFSYRCMRTCKTKQQIPYGNDRKKSKTATTATGDLP